MYMVGMGLDDLTPLEEERLIEMRMKAERLEVYICMSMYICISVTKSM
jgi:hypothetical protein